MIFILTQQVQYVCRKGRATSAHSSKRGIISGLKGTKFVATRNCLDALPYVLKQSHASANCQHRPTTKFFNTRDIVIKWLHYYYHQSQLLFSPANFSHFTPSKARTNKGDLFEQDFYRTDAISGTQSTASKQRKVTLNLRVKYDD